MRRNTRYLICINYTERIAVFLCVDAIYRCTVCATRCYHLYTIAAVTIDGVGLRYNKHLALSQTALYTYVLIYGLSGVVDTGL